MEDKTDYRVTLQEYTDQFQVSLDAYLSKYEGATKFDFIEKERKIWQDANDLLCTKYFIFDKAPRKKYPHWYEIFSAISSYCAPSVDARKKMIFSTKAKIEFLIKQKKDYENEQSVIIPSENTLKSNGNKSSTVATPTFKPEIVEEVFDIIKVYFPKQNKELKKVLETGSSPSSKLLFNGSGKTLLDFFKQLMRGQLLTVPVQRDFEKWVSVSFEYLHSGEKKKFTPKYASKIISGKERAAKGNRLIEVVNNKGRFEIEQVEIKNRQQKVK